MNLLSDYDLAVKILGEVIVQKEVMEQQYNFRDEEARQFYEEVERLKEENTQLKYEIKRLENILKEAKE